MSKDFDRSKFKGSSIAALKQTRKQAEKKSKIFPNSGERPGFHTIDEGINVFRIAPPHDNEDPSYQPLRTTWLECEVPELNDEGEETGKTVMKKKRIFIATIHGQDLKEDPIEAYIRYAYNMANDQIADENERKRFLSPITGWKDKKQKWHPGIRPSTNYVFYAWKDGELGRVELYPVMLKKMEELNIAEDPDDIIEVDCFSDPDDGVSLIIEYNKSAKSGEKYKIKKREFNPKKYKTWEEFISEERLTDDQLQDWFSKASLKSMYKDVYTMRDFDLALNGLAIFDEQNEYGIFENEEFLAELEEIRKQVPEKTEKQAITDGDDIDESFKKGSKTSKPKTKEVESNDEDTSSWSKIKCKKYLTAYILENYGEEEELPELDVDEIREWAQLAVNGEELPFPDNDSSNDSGQDSPEDTGEEPKSQEDDSVNASTSPANAAVADRIAAMREKARKAKEAKQ